MKLYPSRHFQPGSPPPDPAQFGRKAAGLFLFPREWTLPFGLLNSTAHENWNSWSNNKREAWARTAASAITEALDPVRRHYSESDGIWIRSSSVEEGLEQRGQLQSKHFAKLTAGGLIAFANDLFSADPAEIGKI